MAMEIISRKEAKKLGLKRYFTGIPCIRGHIDVRIVGNSNCRACNLMERRNSGRKRPESAKKAARKYAAKDSTKQRQWEAHIKYKYGVTSSDFEKMLQQQNNRCLICKEEFIKTPHVDHNHETGVVRGLLCQLCNMMIGSARENILILQNGITYLEKVS